MHFGVELALACVGEVMDRERRHDGVELAQLRERPVEIVFDDRDRIVVGEAGSRRVQHGGREVEPDGLNVGPDAPHQREHDAVTRAQVEYPSGPPEHLEEDTASFGTVGDLVACLQVRDRMGGVGPAIDRRQAHGPTSATARRSGRSWRRTILLTAAR